MEVSRIKKIIEKTLDSNKANNNGWNDCRIEGKDSSDWKLVDAIDIIVHLFHPEKRKFYDLEKMWSESLPKEKAMI